ncbi:MAG: AMP-binding protein [Desulfobacteraceae bacterium]|nr:AMP-binding protein [Desulfobacteraceae bacterium]
MSRDSRFHVDEAKPWFQPEAGWPDNVPKNIDFPRISIYEMMTQSVEKHPDSPAMWFMNNFMSYAEMLDKADALAAGLKRLGLQKGDVVALALANSFQYVICYFAAAKLGLIVTGINPTYKPDEALMQVRVTGARALIVLDMVYQPIFAPVAEDCGFDHVISTNLADLLEMPPEQKQQAIDAGTIPSGPVPETAVAFTDLLQADPQLCENEAGPDDIVIYAMTGGTTGRPKAAILTHFNVVSSARTLKTWVWDAPGGCTLAVLPLFHIFGIVAMHVSIHNGGYLILFPKPPRTEELVKTICSAGVDNRTFYPGAEVMFQALAQFPDLDSYPVARKLDRCLSSAGPLHKYVKDEFEAKLPGVAIREGYGLTESCSGVSMGPFDKNFPTGSVGLPLPGIDWKIVDMETGTTELPAGETGELILHGPVVMQGYLDNPGESAQTLREREGKTWLHTGDLGCMDQYGRVFLSDRMKQLIKVKGYSVFPTEVEDLVGRHKAVHECAVAGVPDKETGEAVKLWVVLKKDWQDNVAEHELLAWCRENITHYKVPKHIEFIEEIPKSTVGKVLRRKLQEADPLYKASE